MSLAESGLCAGGNRGPSWFVLCNDPFGSRCENVGEREAQGLGHLNRKAALYLPRWEKMGT